MTIQIPVFAEGIELSAELRGEIACAVAFAEAANEAADITSRILTQRETELGQAQEAARRAARSWEAASHAVILSEGKLAKLLDAAGLIRTADGITRR